MTARKGYGVGDLLYDNDGRMVVIVERTSPLRFRAKIIDEDKDGYYHGHELFEEAEAPLEEKQARIAHYALVNARMEAQRIWVTDWEATHGWAKSTERLNDARKRLYLANPYLRRRVS